MIMFKCSCTLKSKQETTKQGASKVSSPTQAYHDFRTQNGSRNRNLFWFKRIYSSGLWTCFDVGLDVSSLTSEAEAHWCSIMICLYIYDSQYICYHPWVSPARQQHNRTTSACVIRDIIEPENVPTTTVLHNRVLKSLHLQPWQACFPSASWLEQQHKISGSTFRTPKASRRGESPPQPSTTS